MLRKKNIVHMKTSGMNTLVYPEMPMKVHSIPVLQYIESLLTFSFFEHCFKS